MINTLVNSILASYSDFFIFLSNLLGSYGVATICLSILATIVMAIPLRWASKIALEEAKIQAVVSPQVHALTLNKTGSERHASINRLYSRYSYHPIFAVRSLMPLFLQLPYLILTYFMFIGLELGEGESFLFIDDLSSPDSLLYGNGNILPFIMTAVNLAAAFLVPHFTLKNLIQATGVSLLFFILLYNERSIILLFWTVNNIIMLLTSLRAYLSENDYKQIRLSVVWNTVSRIMCSMDIVSFLCYVFISSFIFMHFLNEGILGKFTKGLFALSIASVSLLIAVICLNLLLGKNKKVITKSYALPNSKVNASSILLILLPISFIVQYALINHDVMSIPKQLEFVLSFSICFAVFIWLIPKLLSRFIPTSGYIAFALSLSTIFSAFPTLAALNGWFIAPDFALLVFLLASATIIFFLLNTYKKNLLLGLCVIFFSVNTLNVTLSLERNLAFERKAYVDTSNFIATGEMLKKPDIYLLTYDAYVANETMKQYGIDNSAQEQYLVNSGFKLYPSTYSLGRNSITSMSRVLEISDTLQKSANLSTAGSSLVTEVLENNGYHTYGILTPYLLTAQVIGYNTSFPDAQSLFVADSVYKGVLEGQFRFDLIDDTATYSHDEWVAIKRNIFKLDSPQPKFMYTHTGPHHSQNSGKCLPNETELFEERLVKSNLEMKGDIESILASNRDAIIIINGDHGPYLTGDCLHMAGINGSALTKLDLQDRFGAFLAIRWSDDNFEKFDNIRVLQDIFESVFKYLYQTENVLKDRVQIATLADSLRLLDSLANANPNLINDGIIEVGVDKGTPLFQGK
ncbi:MAG: hypothetical protein ACI9VT_001472 [Psychroserpens sp.]|jgi:hypothetical protein